MQLVISNICHLLVKKKLILNIFPVVVRELKLSVIHIPHHNHMEHRNVTCNINVCLHLNFFSFFNCPLSVFFHWTQNLWFFSLSIDILSICMISYPISVIELKIIKCVFNFLLSNHSERCKLFWMCKFVCFIFIALCFLKYILDHFILKCKEDWLYV